MSESITKSAFWQIIGKFSLQGIVFITTPIFTRILTPDNFGTISLYNSWLSILMVILGLQTYGSIANARVKFNSNEMNSYLSSILSISILSFCFFSFIFTIFCNLFSSIFGLNKILSSILIIHSFFNYVLTFYVAYLDQYKKVIKSCLISLFSTLFSTVLSLFFVIKFKDKIFGKILGQVIPISVIGIIILFFIYYKSKCFWNKSYNKYCISLTLPLVLHGLGHMIFTQADHILLKILRNETELGIYSVAYSLSFVVVIIFNALNTAWGPFYFDFKKINDVNEIRKHSEYYIRDVVMIMSGFVLLSYDVYKILAPSEYYNGMKIIPIFVIAFYFSFIYLFPVNFECYHEKTKIIPIATIIAAFFNIFLDIFLIPKYSISGAAFATMLSQILLFLFHYIIAKYFIKFNFEYRIKDFLLPSLFLIIMSIISQFLYNLFIIRFILFIVIAIVLFFDIYKRKAIF